MRKKQLFFFLLILFNTPIDAQTTLANQNQISCMSIFPQRMSYVKQMRFIRKWAAHASRIAFVMNYNISDDELESKKVCFTNSGWSQYTQALHQSGNLNTIKQNQFQTNTMLNGIINAHADAINKTWTLHIPLEIVYQNDKTRIKQNLNVFMLIALQADGRLAIMQVVGKPVEISNPSTSP